MKYFILSTVLLLVFGCTNNKNLELLTQVDIETSLISKGNLYGNGQEGINSSNFIITNEQDWNTLTTKMNLQNNVSNEFTEIDIDFSQYRIIAVFDEIRNSGGYEVDLEVSANPTSIIIKVNSSTPEGGATAIRTQPFNIIKVPKSDLSIVFE